jgi:metal-responsive CopG/Arc/MetJ family transcriptional regulator
MLMSQPNRAKKNSAPRKLTSVNFTVELLDWVDDLSEELAMNRSALVCAILDDFKKSGKTFKIQVVDR